MAFSVKFNNVDLSTIVDGFTAITRNIGAGWTNNLQANPFIGGELIQNSINSKTITVNFIVNVQKDRFTTVRKELASALNVSQPCPLIFDDDPNQIWWAVPDGVPTLDESSFYQALGSITFLVPSGFSESAQTNVLSASNSGGQYGNIIPNSDGSVDISINNTGTLEAFPIIEIKNSAETGYFAIAGQNGAIEIGNRQEADTVPAQGSKVLLNFKNESDFGLFKNSTITHPIDPSTTINGQLQWYLDGIRYSNLGSGSKWHGGMIEFTLSETAQNFWMAFNLFAWAGAMGQTGDIQIMAVDGNGGLIAGYGIVKTDRSGNTGAAKFWTGGNSIQERANKTFQVNNDASISQNPMFNSKNGAADIVKDGSNISFYWMGQRISSYVKELENVSCAKVIIFIGQYGQGNSANMITNLSLRSLLFQKNFTYAKDVPNRYPAGSDIKVDMGGSNIVTVNGLLKISDKIRGTEQFSIPPGISKLKVIQSSWNSIAPDVQISYKERNL